MIYEKRCPDCGAVGDVPDGAVDWWHPDDDERTHLSAALGEAITAPEAHVAEFPDGHLEAFGMRPGSL